ncbi:hypothetical protein PTE01_01720 [Pseudoalteromonas tetraodonis GFC]|jgi:hypothetical protein|uniref:Uncharacterized protein n=1 Tax=Pseudoalteromonas tetraodonis GFC TaxID=1315271 RepID=A0AA37S2D2_9GAMM|nr:hypothetical protein PTE01_01720 [Pseudoalteromonas tetraodonis GFC]GLQ02933.1 hypothetical protein GCM10007914_18140 [Pseudoalteromonas tetraodonis GFC]
MLRRAHFKKLFISCCVKTTGSLVARLPLIKPNDNESGFLITSLNKKLNAFKACD